MRIIDGIEISEAFDGISDNIALKMTKEHLSTTGNQESTKEVTAAAEPTEEDEPVVKSEDKEVETPIGDAPVKEQEDGEETIISTDETNGKTVPYQAMIAERNKRKSEQTKNGTLQAELDQLRAQYANKQETLPSTTKPPVAELTTEQTTADKKSYYDYLKTSALKMFDDEFHREPDGLDFDDMAIYGSYIADVKNGIKNVQADQKKVIDDAQKSNQSYTQFVNDQLKRNEYEEIEATFLADVKALSDEDQLVIKDAFQKCTAGNGSKQDIFLVKKAWNDAASKCVQTIPIETKQPVKIITPPKPGKTAEEKLNEIEKHSKANLVVGNNAPSGTGMDGIARLMREMPWPEFKKLHPEYAKLVLEGKSQ